MALGAGVWLYRHRPRWPRLAGFREITFDGRMKVGREYPLPLFSDGLRIYFTEQTQAGHTLMYTGLEGGVRRCLWPHCYPDLYLQAISPPMGSKFWPLSPGLARFGGPQPSAGHSPAWPG